MEVDRHPVGSATEMKNLVEKFTKGTPLVVLVHRGGSSLYLAVAT